MSSDKAIAKDAPEKKKEEDAFDFDTDEGWADDGDDDDAVKAAKAKKEEKEKLAKQVAMASGKDEIAKNIKIEGLDDGVLGQAWVERTLEGIGQWPPKFDDSCKVKDMTFAQGKKTVSVLEHRAARRNLCMTLGRLNALKLNTHPGLRKFFLLYSVYLCSSDPFGKCVLITIISLVVVTVTPKYYAI